MPRHKAINFFKETGRIQKSITTVINPFGKFCMLNTMNIVDRLNLELSQSLLGEILNTPLLTIIMPPITRQTRNVPHATIFPRVAREIRETITRRNGSSTANISLGSSNVLKFKDRVVTIRSVTSPVAVLNPRSTMSHVSAGEKMSLSSGAVVGVVLGCVLGFMVLLGFGYMCCVDKRCVGLIARGGVDGDGGEMVYRDRRDSEKGQGRGWKSRARGGGGEGWVMRGECGDGDGDGDGVRRLDKAVVRDEKRGRERIYRKTGRERDRDRKWNINDNNDRRNISCEWERGGNRRRRRRRRRKRNTWVVVERKGIFSWGKPVRKSRGRSLQREREMSGECGEFGWPVRSWRGEGRNGRMGGGDKGLRFDVRDGDKYQ